MTLPLREPKKIQAKYAGTCSTCGINIVVGELCYFTKAPGAQKGEITCSDCYKASQSLFGPDEPQKA